MCDTNLLLHAHQHTNYTDIIINNANLYMPNKHIHYATHVQLYSLFIVFVVR